MVKAQGKKNIPKRAFVFHLEVFLRAHGVVKHEYYTHNPHGGVRGVYVGCRTIDKPFGSLLVPKVRGIY